MKDGSLTGKIFYGSHTISDHMGGDKLNRTSYSAEVHPKLILYSIFGLCLNCFLARGQQICHVNID